MTEVWLPVVGYEEIYEVSDQGRIRRQDGKYTEGGLRTLSPHPGGYLSISLQRGGRAAVYLVHRVVVAAFIGPCPCGECLTPRGRHDPLKTHEVNHRNLVKVDNRPGNLEWVTRADNMRHAADAGLWDGEANHMAIVEPMTVQRIRDLHTSGLGYTRIASTLGLSWGLVRSVVTGKSWSSLDGESTYRPSPRVEAKAHPCNGGCGVIIPTSQPRTCGSRACRARASHVWHTRNRKAS